MSYDERSQDSLMSVIFHVQCRAVYQALENEASLGNEDAQKFAKVWRMVSANCELWFCSPVVFNQGSATPRGSAVVLQGVIQLKKK